MNEKFFPFTVHGSSYYHPSHGGGVNNFKDIFQVNRPDKIKKTFGHGVGAFEYIEDFICYCFDVVIHSATEVEFVCYDMEDNIYGGRGKHIHSFKVKCKKSATKKHIEKRLIERAIVRRTYELEVAECEIYALYADQERVKLGL